MNKNFIFFVFLALIGSEASAMERLPISRRGWRVRISNQSNWSVALGKINNVGENVGEISQGSILYPGEDSLFMSMRSWAEVLHICTHNHGILRLQNQGYGLQLASSIYGQLAKSMGDCIVAENWEVPSDGIDDTIRDVHVIIERDNQIIKVVIPSKDVYKDFRYYTGKHKTKDLILLK